MKWLTRSFGLLDLISFIIVFPQALVQIASFFEGDTFTLIEIFSRFLFIILWLSLLFSAGFLLFLKKVGVVIYYIQLLPRLIFLIFSVGFISVLSHYLTLEGIDKFVLALIIFAEMLRVYYCYQAQQSFFLQKSPKQNV